VAGVSFKAWQAVQQYTQRQTCHTHQLALFVTANHIIITDSSRLHGACKSW
jgi:hypothetical protein